MREEANRREAALNDAELSSVSGGEYITAVNICRSCNRRERCGPQTPELERYLRKSEPISSHHFCPFYDKV